jgi:hypothetical protein
LNSRRFFHKNGTISSAAFTKQNGKKDPVQLCVTTGVHAPSLSVGMLPCVVGGSAAQTWTTVANHDGSFVFSQNGTCIDNNYKKSDIPNGAGAEVLYPDFLGLDDSK